MLDISGMLRGGRYFEIEAKRETLNHVRLIAWQEIDAATYAAYHEQLAHVDDEFSEPSQIRLAPLKASKADDAPTDPNAKTHTAPPR